MNLPGCSRLRYAMLLLLTAVPLIFTSGCAEKRPTYELEMEQEAEVVEDVKPEVVSLEAINVVGNGDSILIEADAPIQYTAFRLEDPPRLVIDLPGVDVGKISSPIAVRNNYINDIVTSLYGEGDKQVGRVEVGMQEGIVHDVKAGEDSILVDFAREMYVSGVSAPIEDVVEEDIFDEAVPVDGELEEGLEPAVEPQVKLPTYDEPEADANAVVDIESYLIENTTVVHVVTDGSVENYNSFGLDAPARVVLDVWGVESALDTKVIPMGGDHLEKIRIGKHPDKVRIVFDAITESVPPFNVEKEGPALIITFGKPLRKGKVESGFLYVEKKSDVAEPVEAEEMEVEEDIFEEPMDESVEESAAEPYYADTSDDYEEDFVEEVVDEPVVEEPASEPEDEWVGEEELFGSLEDQETSGAENVNITNVGFRKLNGVARLTISSSVFPAYDITESLDGKTVTIDIKNAMIPDELKQTLDATAMNTPITTISSYQSSMDAGGEVRVLVKLRQEVLYDVEEDGNDINIDFPITTISEVADAEEPMMGEASGAEESYLDTIGVAETGKVVPVDDMASKEPAYTGEPVTLEMVDAKVIDVLNVLAEVSQLNIVALPDEVTGTITLRLVDVPWDQAFDLILKTKGLDKIQVGNVVRVAPIAKVRAEKEAAIEAKRAQERLEELHTEYIRINYDKASELSTQVGAFLSDRGSTSVHDGTNTLIVKDIRTAIEDVNDYIKRVDIPTPQVLIEARIVQADTSFARDLGVEWGIDAEGVSNGVSLKGGGGLEAPGINTENFAVSLPASGSAGTLGALGFALGRTGANPLLLDLKISAGEQKGLVKTISRPRVVTLDNKEAKIEQGESIPFSTTSAGGTATQFIDANLSLTVKPQITSDGSVRMEIKASKNSIGSFRSAGGEPSIDKKEATTNLLVKNGETTVIGGIIVSDVIQNTQGVPFLKDVPGLGWLFKNKSFSDTQKELLIFITPTILDSVGEGGEDAGF